MTLKIAPHSHPPRFAKRRKMCRSSSADRRQHIRKGPKYQGVLEPQKRTLHTISNPDPSTTWVHLRIPLEPHNFITFPRHLQPFPAKIRPRFCRTTIHLGQLNKKGMRNRASCVKVKLPHQTFRKETIFLMSKSITQDMAYRQSLMKYAEKYGVSRASRKYNKSRSYIYSDPIN